jgi:hypothetical protein
MANGAQRRREDMGDVGLEPVAVDRAIEHHRRDHAVEAEAGDQRRRLAVAVREAHAQPLAPAAAAVRARHVRRCPGLVDEHQPAGVEVRLRLKPGPALPQDVRAVLLDRMAGLFFRVTPWRRKNRERAEVDVAKPCAVSRARSSSSV